MKEITEFNRENLKLLRLEIDTELKKIGEKYGFSIELGNMGYTHNSFNAKVNAAISTDGESPMIIKLRENLKSYANLLGIKDEHIGAKIKVSKGTGELIGYSPKSSRYPFIVQMANGDLIKVPTITIEKQLSIKSSI